VRYNKILKVVLPAAYSPDAACVAVIMMADGVYSIMVAMPSRIVIAVLVEEKVYSPLLLLLPDIIDTSENVISVP
jgi:hypothetical protein